MKKLLAASLTLIVLTILLASWGVVGHKKISESAALSFNPQMFDFNSWTQYLADNASAADNRKSSDPTEGPKHYIDIDNYADFIAKGRIPQTWDSVNLLYGSANVIANGTLPWATKNSFDSLVSCMKRHNFVKAKIFAADLGHYVADGHMPLHITRNYNGAETGQTGIHARYESTMIGSYISQITYTGAEIAEITDVSQYIFNYIYHNNTYVDSVLNADTYAKTFGTTSSSAYKTALWNKTKGFTILLFRNASHALAELIYTAWIQAGSPSIISTDLDDPKALKVAVLDQNKPNPFTSSTRITYSLKENTNVRMEVRDINGKIISTLMNEPLSKGDYSIDWTPENEPAGLYYLVLHTGKYVQVKKMVYSVGR